MKKNIAEDLPARQYPAGSSEKKDSPVEKEKERGKTPDDRIKKALDDIRYRARREGISLLQAYSQYMQTSSIPQQEKMEVKQRLFGKEQSTMKAEDFNIQDFASSNVANALYKVFVENYKEDEPIVLPYIQEMENAKDRKYNVEVIDKDGTSYDRQATREKISKLRANPNIKDIVMKKNDKPERWWDDDGDGIGYEKGEVSGKFKKNKNVKEQFIGELAAVPEDKLGDKKSKEIRPMAGKNTIVMGPKDPSTGKNSQRFHLSHYDMNTPFIAEKAVSQAQQKFMGMVYATKKGETAASPEVAKAASEMSKKEAKKFATTKHKGLPIHKEEMECETDRKKDKDDVRSIPTDVNLRKNKLRAMGLKMSYEPEGEIVDEGMGLSVGAARVLGKAFSNPRTPEAQATKAAQRNITDPIGYAVKGAVKTVLKPVGGAKEEQQRIEKRRPQTPQQKAVADGTLKQSYEPEGESLLEKPNDGLLGPAILGIPYPQSLNRKPKEVSKPSRTIQSSISDRNKILGQIDQMNSYEPEGEVIDEVRKSEKMGMGSPETRHPEGPGGLISGARGGNRRRGQSGGRHGWSGGQDASVSERGKKKRTKGSQAERSDIEQGRTEVSSKYSRMQASKRGEDIPSH